MKEEKYVLFSLGDEKMKSLSKVLGNKTCKRIIEYLSETKEASEKDLSDALSVPLNTVEYNLKKLLESGLIEKRKNFFWSKKGKKILMYELSNKSIVISPKRSSSEKFKSILPAVIITFAGTFALWVYERIITVRESANALQVAAPEFSDKLISAGSEGARNIALSGSPIWVWFLAGGIIALIITAIVNWRKI